MSHKSSRSMLFYYFSSPMCHIHTITLCMAGKGDSLDVVVTCYRLDFRIWPPHWGARNYFFLYLPAPAMGPTHPCLLWEVAHFSWEYSGGGMGPITHPTLALIIRIISVINMLLLYANFVMLWGDLYLLHICG